MLWLHHCNPSAAEFPARGYMWSRSLDKKPGNSRMLPQSKSRKAVPEPKASNPRNLKNNDIHHSRKSRFQVFRPKANSHKIQNPRKIGESEIWEISQFWKLAKRRNPEKKQNPEIMNRWQKQKSGGSPNPENLRKLKIQENVKSRTASKTKRSRIGGSGNCARDQSLPGNGFRKKTTGPKSRQKRIRAFT